MRVSWTGISIAKIHYTRMDIKLVNIGQLILQPVCKLKLLKKHKCAFYRTLAFTKRIKSFETLSANLQYWFLQRYLWMGTCIKQRHEVMRRENGHDPDTTKSSCLVLLLAARSDRRRTGVIPWKITKKAYLEYNWALCERKVGFIGHNIKTWGSHIKILLSRSLTNQFFSNLSTLKLFAKKLYNYLT